MKKISTQHQQNLSSSYHYLFQTVYGIAAMVELFALFLYRLFFSFVYSYRNRLFGESGNLLLIFQKVMSNEWAYVPAAYEQVSQAHCAQVRD